MFIPNVVYKKEGEKSSSVLDIYSRLLQLGIIFFNTDVNEQSSNLFMAQLMYLSYDLMLKEVTVYINSPGGSVSCCMAMINTMNNTNMKIRTICCGMAASAASVLLANGTAGERIALKYSTIMIHQPLVGLQGYKQSTDLEIQSKEMKRIREMLSDLYAKNSCGKMTKEEFDKNLERDNYLTPEKALEFGIVDKII